jgi:catechol 2,3-dioxygenase-like lactoylglutathione lyase family enzyme
MNTTLALTLLFLSAPTWALAQLTAAKDAEVAMGHIHLDVTDIDAHKTFWCDLLGATETHIGDMDVLKLPNLLIFLREQRPTGGTKGSVVDHIGLQIRDIEPVVEKLKSAGVPIVTQSELTRHQAEGDVAYIESQDTYAAFVMGPDKMKVELMQNPELEVPIANHHIHFYTPEVDKMKAWYVEMLGAVPGMRGTMEAADLPGVNLTFSRSERPVVGTQGRTIDHIGFEVNNLESFCKKLEEEGVRFRLFYRTIPEWDVSLAFVIDDWGTYIELTEGLDKL